MTFYNRCINKMIYTSYFGKLEELKKNNIVPISIARKTPVWFAGAEYKKLAPNWYILSSYRKDNDEDKHIRLYKKLILRKLDPMEVYHELCDIAQSDDFAILCYEKPTKFCHRHIVREWMSNAGIKIKEFGS